MITEEESGPAIDPNMTEPPLKSGGEYTIDPILIPPPLSIEQAQKLADAIKAIEEFRKSLGSAGWALGKFVLGKVIQGLKELGPIPPLMPPGTQEPSTQPPTTSP